MGKEQQTDRCSVCGMPFQDTGEKQQCRNCGMFANLCCDPQMPIEGCRASRAGLTEAQASREQDRQEKAPAGRKALPGL
jgi:hypothetical protein